MKIADRALKDWASSYDQYGLDSIPSAMAVCVDRGDVKTQKMNPLSNYMRCAATRTLSKSQHIKHTPAWWSQIDTAVRHLPVKWRQVVYYEYLIHGEADPRTKRFNRFSKAKKCMFIGINKATYNKYLADALEHIEEILTNEEKKLKNPATKTTILCYDSVKL